MEVITTIADGYILSHDHDLIKKQIKKWELTLDEIISMYYESKQKNYFDEMAYSDVIDALEYMSHEMMSINI